MGWLDWLTKEAKNCNPEALAVLRSRRSRQFKGNQISSKQSHDKPNGYFEDGFIKDSSIESITKIGTVTYKTGSTTIRDDGKRLIVLPDTSHDVLVDILQVAMKKHGSYLARIVLSSDC
ncbi:MAG: hypothetical protein LM517_05985 [Nitrosomonas sp.]|nr:hypothetical protein [Nitrosomonas sp.]